MTTQTWIQLGGGVVLGIIALFGFFKMRAMRGQLTRASLFPFATQVAIWTMFGGFFFSGVLSVCYFAAIAAIFIPPIIWILRLPKDDPAA